MRVLVVSCVRWYKFFVHQFLKCCSPHTALPLFFFTLYWIAFGIFVVFGYSFTGQWLGLLSIPQMFDLSLWTFFAYSMLLILSCALRLFWLFFWGAALILPGVFLVQLCALRYTTQYISPEALHHIEFLFFLLDAKLTLLLLGGTIAMIVLLIPIYRLFCRIYLPFSWRRFGMAFAGGSTLFCGVWVSSLPLRPVAEKIKAEYRVDRWPPEVAFFSSTRRYMSVKELPTREIRLSPSELKRLRPYLLRYQPDKRFPMINKKAFHGSLPFPKTKHYTAKPNVILLVLESLSAKMLNTYGGGPPKLTPNIDAFARRGMVVEQFFNHTTPTINGLRGQLCSLYPIFSYSAWARAKGNLLQGPLLCMPHLFDKLGYRTEYFAPWKRTTSQLYTQMKSFGFRNTYFQKRLLSEYLPRVKKVRYEGITDQQMFRAMTRHLKKMERKRGQPFFLTFSTIDTHFDYHLPSDGVGYKGSREQAVRNVMFNLDNAFGKFWRYFRRSPYAKNTIVILTADHAMYRTPLFMAFAGDSHKRGYFDEVAMIVYDPRYRLPRRLKRLSTSADLFPSLLHLLNVNVTNPFFGTSLFTDRAKYPHILGVSPGDGVIFHKSKGKKSVVYYQFQRDVKSCMDPSYYDSSSDRCLFIRWFTYHRYLMFHGRIWSRRFEQDLDQLAKKWTKMKQ